MNKVIVCNWKMNGNIEYCKKIQKLFSESSFRKNFEIVICPPYTLLNQLSNQNFALGAQDCSADSENCYTAEISIPMLMECSVTHVIIGHSERRRYFGESTEKIIRKLNILLESGLNPIICVRRYSEDAEYIKEILSTFSSFINSTKVTLYLAYEPESSIGSGIPDNLYSIEENYKTLSNLFRDNQRAKAFYDGSANRKVICDNKEVKVLYGGSVNHKNAQDILKICDGILLGKASINFDEFTKIICADSYFVENNSHGLGIYQDQDLLTHCN